MPIYEYRCRACGALSEFLTGPGKDETLCCRGCGSTDLERVLSVSSFLSRSGARAPGQTCCGREERCEAPPCASGEGCRRDR